MGKIFKNYDENELKRIEKKVKKILALDTEIAKLSNEELKDKTMEFKKRYGDGETLDSLLFEAFAVAREVIYRVLGKKLYKVQIIGGIVLHQGRIAEMKTGEGKTLTEICPAYLNAITGKGVHIITVNDYLAERDMVEMAPVFEALNLSVGLVVDKTEAGERREQYKKDITYSTNSQLGFDYLRDNTVLNLKDKVQRELNFVIIDEIDSVLIDEARTPLILAANNTVEEDKFLNIDKIVKSLNPEEYAIDLKENIIGLTEKGISKVEKKLNINNLSELEHTEINHRINQSLRANYILKKDKDYIVENNEIVLIDEHTGRIAVGRKMSYGLHQAIEAKELVPITAETITLATITYQNFFKIYSKLSGMSGTVKTDETEFREFYNLDVISIPTNKPIARIDREDIIAPTEIEKFILIKADVEKTHKEGRPILIGTPSVEKSEQLSSYLNNYNISHRLLNAKTNKDEAEIISKAGEEGAITIATNIAGRGTDIKISDEVNQLGGLKIIATERSISRRIDNQLIGRAGRQGNNGESQFYLSGEDELYNLYADENTKKKINKLLSKRSKAGEKKAVDIIENIINQSQNFIENFNYETRKNTVKYDEAINNHREIIYKERNEVLNKIDIKKQMARIILGEVIKISDKIIKVKYNEDFDCLNNEEIEKMNRDIALEIQENFNFSNNEEDYVNLRLYDEIIDYHTKTLIEYYNSIATLYDDDLFNLISAQLLEAVDKAWIYHIEDMEALRNSTNNESYNQKDPLTMYKIASGKKFEELIDRIEKIFIKVMFKDILNVLKENAKEDLKEREKVDVMENLDLFEDILSDLMEADELAERNKELRITRIREELKEIVDIIKATKIEESVTIPLVPLEEVEELLKMKNYKIERGESYITISW